MTDEIIDAFLGQVGTPELIRIQHAEKPLHDVVQRLARGHFAIALVDTSLARTRTRRTQLGDDSRQIPLPIGYGAVLNALVGAAVGRAILPTVAGWYRVRLHRGPHLLSKTPSNSVVLRYRSPESGSIATMVLPAFCG